MSERIFVTGAAGFVGQHLVEHLVETSDAEIVATDIQSTPPEAYAGAVGRQVSYRSGDITDSTFRSALLEDPFDRIFHLAAVVGVNEYVQNPLDIVETNVVATKAILEAVQHTDTRLVFTSTSEIYGKNADVPWTETTDRVLGPPTIDRWSYSSGKGVCEHMIHGLAEADNPFSATVVRPFNLYGPRQRPDFVIPAFINEVVNGGVPTVYDDGTQTRCFTYIDDFIEGLVVASDRPEGENEVFNLGSTNEVAIGDLAGKVLDIAGASDKDPTYIDTEELYGESYEDLSRRVPDTTKAEQLLDWRTETSLEAGLSCHIEWGRGNYTET